MQVCCSKALEFSYTEMTVKEVLAEVKKDCAFYGEKGGITLSGGEPLLQPEETLELLRICKGSSIHTAIETCGCFNPSVLSELVPLVDCFLWDFKDGNEERHRQYTGTSNSEIQSNLLLADSMGAEIILRCIMVRNVNMKEDHYRAIAGLWHRLKHCRYVELIPYHAFGGSKMIALAQKDNGNPKWIPEEADLRNAVQFLETLGVVTKKQNG